MTVDFATVQAIIRDAVSACCDSQIPFTNQIKIEGTIGITVDGSQIALVHLRDAVLKEAPVVTNSCTRCGVDADDVIKTKSHVSTKNVEPFPTWKSIEKTKRGRVTRAAAKQPRPVFPVALTVNSSVAHTAGRQPQPVAVFPTLASLNSSIGSVVAIPSNSNIGQNDLDADKPVNAVHVKTEPVFNYEESSPGNDHSYQEERNEATETDQSGNDFIASDASPIKQEINSLRGKERPGRTRTYNEESDRGEDPTTSGCITRAESFDKEMERYCCSGCSKTFKQFRNLKEHFLVHHRGYRLRCPLCGKEVRSKIRLKTHKGSRGCRQRQKRVPNMYMN